MASSRASSPANGSSPTSPLQLTPTSKVKALLASLDDDSDEETVSRSAGARLNSVIAKKPTTSSPSPPNAETSNQILPGNPESDSQTEDDDDEEDIIRPMGRMAARMQAAKDDSKPDAEDEADNARERVRSMLMAKSKTPEPVVSDKDLGNSSNSDGTVVPRRRRKRTPQRRTPTDEFRPRYASSEELSPEPLSYAARLSKHLQESWERKQKKAITQRMDTAMGLGDNRDDALIEQRLTQQTKPTRKASKMAQEKIAQETQQMSRDMQLTHRAGTRKSYPVGDLLVLFEERERSPSPPARHSYYYVDDTPPTSPAPYESDNENPSVPANEQAAPASSLKVDNQAQINEKEDLPILEETLDSDAARKLDKGKGKATEDPLSEIKVKRGTLFKQRPVRIRPSTIGNRKATAPEDSDSDLEIVAEKTPDKKTKSDPLARVPANKANEPHALQALKLLARLGSPGKKPQIKNQRAHLAMMELECSLQQRARDQCAYEKEAKIQALVAKGVIMPTAEERQKLWVTGEDTIAWARRQAEEIRQKEKADVQRKRGEGGVEHDLFGDSSDDEDWNDGEENADEISGSGSEGDEEEVSDASGEEEDGDDEDGEEDVEDALAAATNPMFDDEAGETDDDEVVAQLSSDEKMPEAGDLENDEDEHLPLHHRSRRARKSNVISDDEDADEDAEKDKGNLVIKTPSASRTDSSALLHTGSPIAANSVLRSATKTFIPGLTVAGPAGLGLTQIFAGTMDDSQIDDESLTAPSSSSKVGVKQDSLALLRGRPAPDLPPFVPIMVEDDSQDVIEDSQLGAGNMTESQSADTQSQSQSQAIQLGFSQSQVHGFDSLVDNTVTQLSEFQDATQDVGFQQKTPVTGRFAERPPSTVDTVVIGQASAPEGTPIVKKKGKLRRRATFSEKEASGDNADTTEQDEDFEISANAFDVMRKTSKAKEVIVDEFDKKTSKAKGMVQDQAEESEDEFAGLGGASDDESGGEDEYVKEMIDDEGGKNVDESKLAALFADHERANDEKKVEKLYSDITKGMLRRKRGADYDLSDSDDGGEARRRMKRKEFAKMRKALLADERIGKIAENPRSQAFIRAIEDRESGDELDFLNDSADQDEATDSQMSQGEASQQQRVPDSQPETAMGPPKRKHPDDAETEPRPPPHLRRTVPSKKPSNLSEIRESLSSLIEEPNAATDPEAGSNSEGELEIEGEPDVNSRKDEKENRNPFSMRRKNVAVVDRISLKRATSSSLSNNTRLAFSTSSASGFKVPPLLRRATTNNGLSSNSPSTSSVHRVAPANEKVAGGAGSDGVKKNSTKSSGVHFFARESERMAVVMKTEKRKEQRLVKGAEVRRKAVGPLFGKGKFE